jgi:cysteinyl-tRNA synthetase
MGYQRYLLFVSLTALLIVASVARAEDVAATTRPIQATALSSVKTFMYQLQNLEESPAVAALASSDYDMLIVEPTATTHDNPDFDMKRMVAQLHQGKPRRIVLAYLNIGQAESYRDYWPKNWVAPTKIARGSPDFLLTPDPDGWSDNYPVAYWDQRWRAILMPNPISQVSRLMNAGFDGLYLDWVDAWDYEPCVVEARRQHVDPAKAMVDLIIEIRRAARAINPQALIVQQNAFGLLDADPRLTDAIDGLGAEDTWYSGKADAEWDSPTAGDIPNTDTGDDSTAGRLAQCQKYLAAGKPVFSIDYCLKPENAARVYREARPHHLVPLVTRVGLDRMTTTPPPAAQP